MRTVYLTFLLLFSNLCLAQTHRLLDITNDFEERSASLYLLEREKGIDAIEIRYQLGGKVVGHKNFGLSELLRGAIVEKDSMTGAEVVIFRTGQGFDAQEGGELIVRFMTNVLLRRSASKTFRLQRLKDRWSVFDKNTAVKGLHMVGNFKLGQVIGIQDLRVRN